MFYCILFDYWYHYGSIIMNGDFNFDTAKVVRELLILALFVIFHIL